MFFIGEIELELIRLGKIETFHFSGTGADSIINDCLPVIEEQRRKSLYCHDESDCSEECRNKGNMSWGGGGGGWLHKFLKY